MSLIPAGKVVLIIITDGVLRHVALVRTDISEERSASVIMVTEISELGTTLAVTCNRRTLRRKAKIVPSSPILVTLMMEELCSPETSVLTRATQRKIPEDGIPHSHCHENLRSYIAYDVYTLYALFLYLITEENYNSLLYNWMF
jgi:hypothetical protein